MAAVKRKTGVYAVVEYGSTPIVCCMAVATFRTERTFVRVFGMARSAVSWRVFETIRCVASAARDGRVQAGQRKRAEIMIEPDRRQPACLRVAIVAAGSQLPDVGVVDRMAAAAGFGNILDACGFVATAAVQAVMSFDEREAGSSVIEHRILPSSRLVTVAACIPVSSLVVIVNAVTVNTAVVERIFEVLATVAGATFQAGVRIGERKSGFGRVIETNTAP